MKKLITLILALTLMTATLFTFSACQPAEKFTGFDIELSRKVVSYLNETYNVNLEIEFTEIDWNSKEALL